MCSRLSGRPARIMTPKGLAQLRSREEALAHTRRRVGALTERSGDAISAAGCLLDAPPRRMRTDRRRPRVSRRASHRRLKSTGDLAIMESSPYCSNSWIPNALEDAFIKAAGHKRYREVRREFPDTFSILERSPHISPLEPPANPRLRGLLASTVVAACGGSCGYRHHLTTIAPVGAFRCAPNWRASTTPRFSACTCAAGRAVACLSEAERKRIRAPHPRARLTTRGWKNNGDSTFGTSPPTASPDGHSYCSGNPGLTFAAPL